MSDGPGPGELTLRDLERCFTGVVPGIIATRAADGTPNVTYLTRIHLVDDQRLALSNQFLAKTARNLAEHPRASLVLLDPRTYEPVPPGHLLRADRTAGTRLRAPAGRRRPRRRPHRHERGVQVARRGHLPGRRHRRRPGPSTGRRQRGESAADRERGTVPTVPDIAAVAELAARLGRSGDLDTVVGVAVDCIADLLGYRHVWLALHDEGGERLFTIASHGYEAAGVGSELALGEGIAGRAAERGEPVRIGNLRQAGKYSRSVRRSFEAAGEIGPGREVPLPGLPLADSCLAVPAMALGQLIGVLVVESRQPAAFSAGDEAVLRTAATLVAASIEVARAEERVTGPRAGDGTRAADMPRSAPVATPATAPAPARSATTTVRFFAVDGSTFFDGDYVIKGVAGRILWSLLRQHAADGRAEFTNREVRLDPSLDLPSFRDNLEGRLIMLKRRLEERDAPVRIEKTGRGRFRLVVTTDLRLEPA